MTLNYIANRSIYTQYIEMEESIARFVYFYVYLFVMSSFLSCITGILHEYHHMDTLSPINIKRARQLTQTTLFSQKRKKSCSGGIQTHDTLLARQMLYPLSYRGSPMVGSNQNYIQRRSNLT